MPDPRGAGTHLAERPGGVRLDPFGTSGSPCALHTPVPARMCPSVTLREGGRESAQLVWRWKPAARLAGTQTPERVFAPSRRSGFCGRASGHPKCPLKASPPPARSDLSPSPQFQDWARVRPGGWAGHCAFRDTALTLRASEHCVKAESSDPALACLPLGHAHSLGPPVWVPVLLKCRRETSSNAHNGFIAVEREECEKERSKQRSCMANPQDSAQRCPFGCKGQGCHPGPEPPSSPFSHYSALGCTARPLEHLLCVVLRARPVRS